MADNTNSVAIQNAVTDMFARNDRLISQAESGLATRRTKQMTGQLKLALAVILVELASCDENFHPQELEVITIQLEKLFNCSRKEIARLTDEAKLLLTNMRGTSTFCDFLAKNLDTSELDQVADAIEQLIDVDGNQDGYELFFKQRLFDRLGIKRAGQDKPASGS